MKRTYKKDFKNKIPLNNKNTQQIMSFYLFECPVNGTSFRGKTFEDYGWHGSVQFGQLKKKMLEKASPSLQKSYYPCSKAELEKHFKLIQDIHPIDEYCVFLRNEENTVMQSLFSAIRNAFAHGSFSVREYSVDKKKTKVYFFSNYDKYLKAEIVLQETTLLEWIPIVRAGYIHN